MEIERWMSEGESRAGGEGYLPSATPDLPPHHPLIPGMMSAFIDFVKPFSMLLPMCLQDSKSRSIQGGGLWGEIWRKHPSRWEQRALRLSQ